MVWALGAGARAGVVLAVAAGLGAAALAAAFAGLWLCVPTALPGDEGWLFRYLLGEAFALVVGKGHPVCPLGEGRGEAALAAVGPLRMLALSVPALAFLWEVAGWQLRLALLRLRGGHAVLAGPPAVVGSLAPGAFWRLWLVPEGAERQRLWPPAQLWHHRVPMVEGAGRAGLGRAALVVAAAQDDLANYRLARRALEEGCRGRVLVQIESRAMRSLGADALRAEAGRQGAELTVVAPHLMQAREALALAMPGRYRDDAAGEAWHLAVCGDGPGVDDLIARLARQGYGLERQRPRLSVLRVGKAEPSALETPPWAADLLDLTSGRFRPRILTGSTPRSRASPWRRRVFRRCSAPLRPRAWPCFWRAGGNRCWPIWTCRSRRCWPWTRKSRRVAPPRALPCWPPVPAWTASRRRKRGWTRAPVRCMRITSADRGHGRRHGCAVAAPLGRPSGTLSRGQSRGGGPSCLQDGAAGLAMVASDGGGGLRDLPAASVEVLAEAEHARWMAARRVAGWTHGPRDDAAQTHPDLVPYADLDGPARDKDRDQVARLPALVALGGEALAREWPVRIGGAAPKVALTAMAALRRRHPDRVPVLHGGFEAGDLAVLAAAQSAGYLTALIAPGNGGRGDWTPLAREVRRKAYRLRMTGDPQAVLAAMPALDAALAEEAEHGTGS